MLSDRQREAIRRVADADTATDIIRAVGIYLPTDLYEVALAHARGVDFKAQVKGL